jgi:ribosome-associated translation inhibitor RaiA
MQIIYRYEQLDKSPALETLAEGKMASIATILAGYDKEDAILCSVEFERATGHHHGDVYTVRVNLSVEGNTITADATGNDIYRLVDEVRDTLHGAVQRFKEQDVARRHGQS